MIAEGQDIGSFAWSPDSRTLAYSVATRDEFDSRNGSQIYLIAADGSGAPRLFGGAGQYNDSTSFSPDGGALLYVASYSPQSAGAPGRTEIRLAPLSGGDGRIVIANTEGINSLVFSPDGRNIAYSQTAGPIDPSGSGGRFGINEAIYVVDREGRNRRFIAEGLSASQPTYSPDGRFLAYSVGSGRLASSLPDQAVISIYIARADGSSASRLFMPEAGRGSQYLGNWVR